MINFINNRTKNLSVPDIRQFANKVVEYNDGINLTIGEPDFPTPENVKQAAIKAINHNLTGYSHNAGLLELRKSVAKFFKEKYHFSYNPEDEIIITNGASEGIDSILRTILVPGDEVVMMAPIYSAYEPIVHLCGAKVVYLDTTKTNFLPDIAELKKLITNKTKVIIMNYPSNPTGVTLTKEIMDDLVQIISNDDIFVISDEIYSENTFDEKHLSFGSYPDLRQKLFLVHGLSKSHAMTGWRVGFVLGDKEVMKHVLKVHLYNSICTAVPSQYAAIEALNNSRQTPSKMNKQYVKRRDFVMKRLENMGLSVIKPKGAFYIFPSITNTGMTSLNFAKNLLEKEHVAVVPGSGFTHYGEGFIRISYANSLEVLNKGMDRIERFLNNLPN